MFRVEVSVAANGLEKIDSSRAEGLPEFGQY